MGKTKNLKKNERKALTIAHPNSRKAAKLAKQTIRGEGKKKQQIQNAIKRNLFGEKLFWFKENLEEGVTRYSAEQMKELFLKYLTRFDNELEQIKLKHSIGQRKSRQHASREDAINITIEKDKNEFFGGGIEMVDIMNHIHLTKLREWDGNMGFLNQMKMRFFSDIFFKNYKLPKDQRMNQSNDNPASKTPGEENMNVLVIPTINLPSNEQTPSDMEQS